MFRRLFTYAPEGRIAAYRQIVEAAYQEQAMKRRAVPEDHEDETPLDHIPTDREEESWIHE